MEVKITIGKDCKWIDLPHLCENCFKGNHCIGHGKNLLGKACLCICDKP